MSEEKNEVKKEEVKSEAKPAEAAPAVKSEAAAPAEAAKAPAAPVAPAAEKKEEPKKEKPSNCAGCNKSIKKKRWYYRNGKYFCTKRCWDSSVKKSEEKKEGAQPAS